MRFPSHRFQHLSRDVRASFRLVGDLSDFFSDVHGDSGVWAFARPVHPAGAIVLLELEASSNLG